MIKLIQLAITLTIMFGWYHIGTEIANNITRHSRENPDWADIGMGMILGLIMVLAISGATYLVWTIVGHILN